MRCDFGIFGLVLRWICAKIFSNDHQFCFDCSTEWIDRQVIGVVTVFLVLWKSFVNILGLVNLTN